MSDIPRRNRIDQMTPAELAIRDAMSAVEAAGADVRLTDAVVLLGQAQNKVADFVDGVMPDEQIKTTAAELAATFRNPLPVCATAEEITNAIFAEIKYWQECDGEYAPFIAGALSNLLTFAIIPNWRAPWHPKKQ